MIQMYHVDKRYPGETYGLRDVSVAIEPGEFVFLTGPSGAGKTTFLRLLFGAERPTAGQILVGGRNVSRLNSASVPELRRQIGVIFQDFKLLNERSVFENVAITLEIAGVSHRELQARTWSMLRRLGLGPIPRRRYQSICQSRSCELAYPIPNQASRSVAAVIDGIP